MTSSRHEVAIVGMGCRLPGGVDCPAALVKFLQERGDGVRPVPATRWSIEEHFDPNPKVPGKAYVKQGGFLTQDVFAFDPAPFGISPREADRLDPQQRLLLEVTWDAFEDAGLRLDLLRGSDTAVFIGGFTQDHQLIAMSEANRELIDSHTSVGASMTVLSNRLSYTFDWRGASATVDTACSSSLVALHLACEEIATGRAALAIAGGVNVMLTPHTTIAMCKGQFLAPDGRSKSFDALADGYGRGEGAGVVVLKRLDLAVRDGDRIHAVVCATGVNQDGRTDGMPMPNGDAQLQLALAVLARSGLAPSDIGYVEAHGTGTRAGDPVEIRAIGGAYGSKRETPLFVGSIKSNIGHLEAAAGVTGLIKAVLSVSRREIFPLRGLTQPNPAIPFEELNVELPLEVRPWPTAGRACAAVNAFGYGGTNAHVIVAEYRPAGEPAPRRTDEPPVIRPRLVPLSAACQPALRSRAADVAVECSDGSWRDVAHTLALARTPLTERAVVIANDVDGLVTELRKLADNEPSERRVVGKAPSERKLLWVFTGMGPQRPGMGQELYRFEPVFRDAVEAADAAFRESSGWSILAEMFEPAASSKMRSNYVAQPANFVLQVGLVALLRDMGVPEHGMLGHSVGELAAAWASGCLSLREAARIAFHRSRLQQKHAGQGGMLAVGAPATEITRLLGDDSELHIAAFNGPASVTLAGSTAALERAAAMLDQQGVFQRRVPVEVAYHSPVLESLREEFVTVVGKVDFNRPELPVYSTADGVRLSEPAHDCEYWWRNAREPVLLQRALEAAIHDGFDAFVEIGPHPVLGASVREVLGHLRRDGHVAYTMRRGKVEQTTVLSAVAELHANGTPLDWSRLSHSGRRTPLPRYPFQRRNHWVESNESRETRLGRSRAQPLLARRDAGPSPRFSTPLMRPSLAYLNDHRIEGSAVFPAAGYVEAALSACVELTSDCRGAVLEDMRFERVFVLRPEATPTLVVDVPNGEGLVSLYGKLNEDAWEKKSECRIRSNVPDPEQHLDLAALETVLPVKLDIERLYADLSAIGLEYGEAFRRIEKLNLRRDSEGGGVLLGMLSSPDAAGAASSVHPTVLDAAFHALLALSTDATAPLVPTFVRRLCWWESATAPRWVHGVVSRLGDGSLSAELRLADETGRVVLDIRGLEFRSLSGADAPSKIDAWLYTDAFEEVGATPAWPNDVELAWYGNAPAIGPLCAALAESGVSHRRVTLEEIGTLGAGAELVVAFESGGRGDGGITPVVGLRALLAALGDQDVKLRVLTFAAHAVDGSERVDPDQAALWGFSRVVMTERPELDLRLVDATIEDDWSGLLATLVSDDVDEEVAVRKSRLFARRLRRLRGPSEPRRGSTLLSLSAHPMPAVLPSDPTLGDTEVRIRTLAIGIHPSDLTLALKPSTVGGSARRAQGRAICGEVVATGSEVRSVMPGDLVHTFQDGDIKASLTVPVQRLVRLPGELSATASVACEHHIAAWQALSEVVETEPGDIVIVEGAATPYGASCVEVARVLGARVVAIVAREEQRSEALARGATLALLDGSADVEAQTRAVAPAGVCAVLSASPVTSRPALLALLRDGGHFVALSGGEPARGTAFPEGISVSSVSLGRTARERPEVYVALASSVLARVARAELSVPNPRTFAPADTAAAFAALSDADQGGPLVLDLSNEEQGAARFAAPFRKDRSYLVTGGLAGFGLAAAEWMANLGAGTLVLASRRGTPDAEASAAVERMRAAGTEVVCAELDVTDEESVVAVLARIRQELAPLAGVFHAATVLADGPLASTTEESLTRAMAAKARGAWLLHDHTRAAPLDHFVLFSSISALVGNPSQAGYAAANAYLDGLSALRRAEGLPAISVSWGAVKDAGIVARDSATRAHLASLGIRPMPARLALAALRTVLDMPNPQLAIVDMDWDRWVASFPATPWRRLAELVNGTATADNAAAALKGELASLEPAQRTEYLVTHLRETTAAVLRLTPENLDPGTSLRNHGLDSLMALELQVAIEKATGVAVPTIEILAGVSVNDLVALLLARLESKAPATLAEPRPLRAGAASSTRALRERLLAQICVQPPYFALDDLVVRGEWVHATARPVAPRTTEGGIVSCAEAARHLAIAGSCAASLVSPIPGRVFYPVKKAIYRVSDESLSELPLRKVFLSARCLDFDVTASRARAETRLCNESGAVLQTLVVDYHVIPERNFHELFSGQARKTSEGPREDPYRSWLPLPQAPHEVGEGFEVSLGTVQAAHCLGHFPGFPALPVSIMTRYAVELVAALREKQHREGSAVAITGGEVETRAFVFAGQEASLRARQGDAASGASESWYCEVTGDGRLAASFRFDVRTASVRTSGIYQTGESGATADLVG